MINSSIIFLQLLIFAFKGGKKALLNCLKFGVRKQKEYLGMLKDHPKCCKSSDRKLLLKVGNIIMP